MKVTQVTDDVFMVTGTEVNWVILREGSDLTLVDGGYPGDAAAVVASVESIGRRVEDITAVLLTHAHVDHIGGVGGLLARHDIPVLAHEDELPFLRGESREQASVLDVLVRAWRPRVARWALAIAAAGARNHVLINTAEAFPTDGPLDLPGRPRPVHTPGHTSGHAVYELAETGIVLTGDALVTGHRLSTVTGPQMLPGFFTKDDSEADSSLDVIAALSANTIVPGHGEVWRGELSRAVEQARAHATRRSRLRPQSHRGGEHRQGATPRTGEVVIGPTLPTGA